MVVTDPTDQLPEELPKTASSLPLVGLVGVLSLATAFALRSAKRKYNHGQN
jgi:LPXTG-motif cell wall-anchored protein